MTVGGRAVVTWLIVAAAVSTIASTSTATGAAPVDAATVVAKWIAATRHDFEMAPQYEYRERIRDDDGVKTYSVMLLAGTPFKRLVAVDGKPLTGDAKQREDARLQQARADRSQESPSDRAHRVAEYKKHFDQAHRILEEMPHAFRYAVAGRRRAGARTVLVLQATPRPGYDPPNVEARVLTGTRGEFWIDASTYQLVRGTAHVIHPVSIAGFIATIQPGTEFEIEQRPVDDDVWLPSRFQIRSTSSIIFLFHHHTREDRTFFDYHRAGKEGS